MTGDDDLLRGALRELADEARPPVDLTGRALRRGRRLRRRRRLTTVAVAGLAILATATIPYARPHHTPRPPAVTPTPSVRVVPAPAFAENRPYAVLAGLFVTSIGDTSGTNGHLDILDRAVGGYRTLPTSFNAPLPSPDGHFVVDDGFVQDKLRVTDTIDLGDRSIDNIDEPAQPQWSPTGNRLVLFRSDGFQVVDAADEYNVRHVIPEDQRGCIDICEFTWLADGASVASPQEYQAGNERSQVSGIAIFDARTGELERNVPVHGAPLGMGAWSPGDGSVLIRTDDGGSGRVLVARTSDGQIIGGLHADQAFFLSDGTIFGQWGAVLTHYDADGRPLETMHLPAELATKALTYGAR